jgi:hypothetical protein
MVRGHNGVDKRIYLSKQSHNSVSTVKQRGKFDSFYHIYNWVLHLPGIWFSETKIAAQMTAIFISV